MRPAYGAEEPGARHTQPLSARRPLPVTWPDHTPLKYHVWFELRPNSVLLTDCRFLCLPALHKHRAAQEGETAGERPGRPLAGLARPEQDRAEEGQAGRRSSAVQR